MPKLNHTPGPWRWTDRPGYRFLVQSSHGLIADLVRKTKQPDAERQANARLIAAAPELYTANQEQAGLIAGAQQLLARYLQPDGLSAREVVSLLLEHFDGPEQRRVEEVRDAALRKARGE